MTAHARAARRLRQTADPRGVLRQLALLGAGVCALVPAIAHGAPPTTAECLAASDSSIEAANAHRLRAERAQLLLCSASSCPPEIRTECIRRVEEVNTAIPTVIFEARDASGADLWAASVAMDGELLAPRLDGVALAVDPGEHTFTFQAAGQPLLQKKFVIREGQKERREVIAIDWPSAPPVAGGSRGRRTRKMLAVVTAGVGVVGVGVGTAFGLDALSKRDVARGECPQFRCPDTKGASMWSDAMSSGDISTAAFVVGAAALGGAAVLWLTADEPPAKSRALQIGIGPGSLRVRGQW